MQFCVFAKENLKPRMENDIYEEKASIENDPDLLKKRIIALEREVSALKSENMSLKEELSGRDCEISYSIEETVVKRLEEENRNLKNLLEDYYKVTLKNWFEEAKKNVK